MRKLRVIAAASLALGLCGSDLGAQVSQATNAALAPSVPAGIHAANPNKIRAHVKFLASDLLEGRGTGQRGGDIAAEYIATQFAFYGLTPGGDNGTYFQDVPMIEVKTLDQTSFTLVSASLETLTLKNLEDFVVSNESQTETAYIDAPIVFVGYGIEAPEYDWDDYKGTDLKGKVALLFVGEPASDDPKFFRGKTRTYHAGWTYKFEETARRGAVATLIIHRTDLANCDWAVVRNSWGKARAYLRGDAAPKLQAAAWIQPEVAKKLVSAAGLDLDQLFRQAQAKDFKPMELPVRLQARVVSQLRPFVSRNVLGVLGTRGATAGEAVLYTAHYDHLGVDPDLQGHNIYNGAIDNAMGCGVLLELARMWSEVPVPPLRTMLFAALTGEEQGLLGSEYLGRHSPVPPAKISLNLNYDTLIPIGDPEEVEANGAERTTFYPVVEAKAKAFDLTVRPDPRPEVGSCNCSDSLRLARLGIPSFSLAQGLKFKGHDTAWGETEARKYLDERYHQPTDVYSSGMDFTGAAKLASFGYELGTQAASQLNLVSWLPGDEFEAERKRSQALLPPRRSQSGKKPKPIKR